MDGYTPRTGGRKKNITLTAKEYTKVTGTIASVRRSRNEPSFIAETSFVRAPLNSRVSSTHVVTSKGKGVASQESLENVPIDIQEAMILEDLLYVLMGIEGTYITHSPNYSPDEDDPLQGIRFVISTSLDSSLRDLVERILPLATSFTAILAFVEHRSHLDCGLVNHALCAAIRDMLKEYQTLLSQLEHAYTTSPTFSLQKLWFYVHPTIHTLSLIYQLVLELAGADDPSQNSHSSNGDGDGSDDSEADDPEEDARNEALGMGNLKAVLSDLKNSTKNSSGIDSTTPPIAVKGGEVLTIIYSRMQSMSGDPTAHLVYSTLLKKAGKPYVGMFRLWVTSGNLLDPYEEFCVKESPFIDKGILDMDYTDDYWERRYTLRDGSSASSSNRQAGIPPPRSPGGRLPGGACVPPLLEGWKHKILLAGKYLNVIRECGIEIRPKKTGSSDEDDSEFGMDDEKFYTFLEQAYTHANHTLLQLIMDQQLIPRLRSLKHVFFLYNASFLTHLLDSSRTELRKTAKSASISKLQSLLDLALASGTMISGSAEESLNFNADVKVTMAGSNLYDWLIKIDATNGIVGGRIDDVAGVEDVNPNEESSSKKGKEDPKNALNAIDALTLDYTVKFPLSLVISRKTILQYQLLFRFLLHLKHAEQSLSNMWIEHKMPLWRRPTTNADLDRWRLRVNLLRARMLSFVQHLLAFATFEVIEPNWRKLEAKLAKVTTVDELLRDHVDFLITCLKECMLTSGRLLKVYQKLIKTCTVFPMYVGHFTAFVKKSVEGAPETREEIAKRWDFFSKFETNFNHWFNIQLDQVRFFASSENVALLPLVVRLNSIKTTAS